ncbi:MAG: histidine kinase [Lachnospiraceae bacterium]|nr:histidine kinase [Lachnospiraceae bacterium]
MILFLRSFIVACCFLTGIYYVILFRLDKRSRGDLLFPALCFVFGFSSLFRLSLDPSLMFSSEFNYNPEDNFFLATLNFSSLILNLYNGYNIPDERSRFYKLFNIICIVTSATSLIIPASHVVYYYLFSLAVALVAYCFGIYISFKLYNSVSKTYRFALASNLIMMAALIPDTVTIALHLNFISLRGMLISIYLALHVLMLTIQYRESISKTTRLSKALSETIEKISHSDNALKCTQMKPDFLYETLDLISRLCLEDPFTAEDLTISLSKYLRHTLNFQQLQGIVPLSNELELTKAYVAIEREIFKNVKFECKLPESVPNVYVPPLSIQPLVENALVHGFRDKEAEGKITISVTPYKDYCHIDVSDNGKGISEEMLQGLPASFAQTAHIGLYNIEKRLISKFHTGLVIQSEEGLGTSISFTVPPEGKYDDLRSEVTA